MKKTQLRRKKPLKPKKQAARIQGREPIRKRNVKRAKEQQQIAFGEKSSWIRSLPCTIGRFQRGECGGKIEAAHTKSRGAGGTSQHLIPLCTRHHTEQHLSGCKTFATKYGLDLNAIAERLDALWQQMQERLAA